ncbi:MAG TPA: EAL domain-containing protein [Roseateles sp.]|nr:EAL domain-containing protein [Roseateles sp.]HWT54569.1 EAL domain-containing protein [Rhodocyclaceae bacterium]
MNHQILLTLLNNAALLLLIVYLYDLASSRVRFQRLSGVGVPVGLALGLVGMAIMLNPMYMTDGVFFDTRSVLLGISGLFFGFVPTCILMLVTAAYRFYVGGIGAPAGVCVILGAGCLGLLWRRWRRDPNRHVGIRELYLFGVVLHVCMLIILVLLLPKANASTLLDAIALPVMLVYPVATALLGTLIGSRIKHERQADALAESEAHFQSLYQYAPVALWKEDRSAVKVALDEIRAKGHADFEAYFRERPAEIWRLAGLVRVLDVNEAALALVGANALEDTHEAIDGFFNSNTIHLFTEQLIAMSEGLCYHHGETSITRLDGEVRDVVISLFVLPGHEETYGVVMTSTMDITAQKAYQTEIRESHKLLSNLAEHVPGMIFQYQQFPDGSGHYPYISKGVQAIYGATPEQVNADPQIIVSRIHPDDRPAVMASIEYSMRTLELWSEEYRVVLPDGGVHWRSGNAQPERQPDGSTTWHGYVRDISDRRRSEERLQLASRVFESASEAILVTDAKARIVAANPAFTRVTGYSEAEVKGRNPNLLASGRHDDGFYRAMWATLQKDGAWSGDIWNRRKNGEVFPEWLSVSAIRDAHGHTQSYVAVFSDLTEIHRAQLLAERMALEDAMTGLGNRSAFVRQLDKRIGELVQSQRHAGMVILDIDRFKAINETHGLMFGDLLLKEVATRMRQLLGLEHFVGRIGADEFGILLAHQSSSRDEVGRLALDMVEQLLTQLLEPYRIGEESIDLNFSVGIVVFPDDLQDKANDVLQQADWATSQSRDQGGGQTVFFQAVMGQQIRDRYRLEQELRRAAPENQLRIYLQPQVDAAGRQVSAEALIRWEHPQRGLVPPGMFIPLAESSDLIFELERWMLREACQLLAQLDARGQLLRIALNISAKHFEQDGFVDEVRSLLALTGADPAYLVFEITESIIIDNMAGVTAKMLELAGMGVHFSLDDFGTGYSSLSYLKRLPIHELKIDRSFIMDAPTTPSDAALVETILGVARTLGLQVVAEGVETQAQADFLKARGDVIHQGYLYDKPMPLVDWLDKYIDKKQ